MFTYFDNRMTRRLDQLKDTSGKNSSRLEDILGSAKKLYDFISHQQVINKVYTNMGLANNIEAPIIAQATPIGL